MSTEQIQLLVLLILPILLIQIGLGVFALFDLSRRAKVRGDKRLWAVILIVTMAGVPTGIIASAIYLAWGRNVEATDD